MTHCVQKPICDSPLSKRNFQNQQMLNSARVELFAESVYTGYSHRFKMRPCSFLFEDFFRLDEFFFHLIIFLLQKLISTKEDNPLMLVLSFELDMRKTCIYKENTILNERYTMWTQVRPHLGGMRLFNVNRFCRLYYRMMMQSCSLLAAIIFYENVILIITSGCWNSLK